MQRILYVIFVLAGFLLFNSCDTPLSEYVPKDDEEKNIVNLLNTYIDARNNGDMNTLASLFLDNGQYVAGVGRTFTKSQIAESQPAWWVQMGKIRLLNSEFTITGNEARVSSTAKWGKGLSASPYTHVATLVKEDGRWLFLKIETGT